MEDLNVGRISHSCAILNEEIIVSGGLIGRGKVSTSTEIISLSSGTSSISSDLNIKRYGHGMGIAYVGNQSKLLAFGGSNHKDLNLDSIEEWNESSKSWNLSELTLSDGKSYFGHLSIPSLQLFTMCCSVKDEGHFFKSMKINSRKQLTTCIDVRSNR